MSEPLLLVLSRDEPLSDDALDALREAGVIVLQVDDPAAVRLLRPETDVDAGDMLRCAMRAIRTSQVMDNPRIAFANELAALIEQRWNERQRGGGE